jgi:hypothetical protein
MGKFTFLAESGEAVKQVVGVEEPADSVSLLCG